MPLTRDQIVGQRLERIVQSYELLDGYLDYTDNLFVLESGLAFRLPPSPKFGFAFEPIPPTARPIVHPLLKVALHSPIAEVYRPQDEEEWFPDSILLRTASGLWISQRSCAPQGTGAAGVLIEREFDGLDNMVPFWPVHIAADSNVDH